MRKAVPIPTNTPHPNPLPVRRGEGEAAAHSLGFVNSTAVWRGNPGYAQRKYGQLTLPLSGGGGLGWQIAGGLGWD